MRTLTAGLKRIFSPRDMTQGNPMTEIMIFSIPLLLGNFAQQLYNTVDAIIVGNYIGDDALGAVGLTAAIINLLLALFTGISTGAGIVVAQYCGAKDRLSLSRSVGTIIVVTFWVVVLMTVVGVLAARPILLLLNTPASMLEMSYAYMSIFFAGIAGFAFFNMLSGVLRGLGDSTSPLLYLLIATVLNIFLDILFVTAFHMSTDGVALATVISQCVSAILCYLRLTRMTNTVDVNRKSIHMDKAIALRAIRLGLPAGLTYGIITMQAVIVQSLMNSLGPMVVTTYTAVMRVDGFAMMPNFTFGIAATTFTGQNLGAKQLDRVHQGTKATMKLALICSSVLVLCILLFGRQLVGVFTDTEAIVSLGARMMRILAVGYIAFGLTQTLGGVMRGMSETVVPMWIGIIQTLVIRLPLAYLFAAISKTPEWPNGDPSCLYWSLLISWVSACLITIVVYRKGKWRKRAEAYFEPGATLS
ncbi:MAG: MATE family efflux transporter [Eubacteriales bacterium]|nr:MATE family efflux transporter [Eubacteriales bacterium]